MSETISIKPCTKSGYVLVINPETALRLGIDKKQMGYVSFGTQKRLVYITISDEVQQNQIHLSKSVMDYLYLPDYPDFEVRINGNEVVIGPHIGIFYQTSDAGITKDNLKIALKYISQYPKLHGSVILFALDKVDQSKRLIEGYCYNPKLDAWQRGTFPYPLSIYLWVILDNNWKSHFVSAIGDTLFNNHYLNKLEMYKWLSTRPSMVQHLPYSILYNSSQDIFDMLKRYGEVYVKPIAGFHGDKVVKVSNEHDGIAIRYRENESNMEKYFNNPDEARDYIEKLIVYGEYPDQYIVQQPINLMTYKGSVVDFRLVMIKDDHGKWACKTIVARIGAAGSVVSNICNGGKAMVAGDLFRSAMGLPDAMAAAMQERIRALGLKICTTLDILGINNGNLGLDIGIDKNGHTWLIEINSRRPDPLIATDVKDIKLYYELVSAPLFYAKFLAGFEP